MTVPLARIPLLHGDTVPGMHWDVMVRYWRSLCKLSSRTEEVPAVFPQSEKQATGDFMHSAKVTCSNEASVFGNFCILFWLKKKVVLSSPSLRLRFAFSSPSLLSDLSE